MEIVGIFLALLALGGISAYVKRKCNSKEGSNMGERIMKEKWGIEERKEYHE